MFYIYDKLPLKLTLMYNALILNNWKYYITKSKCVTFPVDFNCCQKPAGRRE